MGLNFIIFFSILLIVALILQTRNVIIRKMKSNHYHAAQWYFKQFKKFRNDVKNLTKQLTSIEANQKKLYLDYYKNNQDLIESNKKLEEIAELLGIPTKNKNHTEIADDIYTFLTTRVKTNTVKTDSTVWKYTRIDKPTKNDADIWGKIWVYGKRLYGKDKGYYVFQESYERVLDNPNNYYLWAQKDDNDDVAPDAPVGR